jgi:hypothetical protein
MEPNENIDQEKQNQLKLQQTYFQLTTEDYENIWFRIKEKVGKWLLNREIKSDFDRTLQIRQEPYLNELRMYKMKEDLRMAGRLNRINEIL